jgi:hypothetical protein
MGYEMTDDELQAAALRNLPQSVKSGPSYMSFELGHGNIGNNILDSPECEG